MSGHRAAELPCLRFAYIAAPDRERVFRQFLSKKKALLKFVFLMLLFFKEFNYGIFL